MATPALRSECHPLVDWDVTPWLPRAQLYHADRAMQDAHIELITQRCEGGMLNVKNASELVRMAAKKLNLKRNFVRINRVIRENKAGTLRTTENITERGREMVILAEQISLTRKEILTRYQIKEQMEIYVQHYSQMYENFLEEVAISSPEFQSVRGILDRYENLERCRGECERLLEGELSASSKMREDMSQLMMEQETRLKKMHNSLEMITVRYKEARDTRVMWEHKVKRLRDNWHKIQNQDDVMRSGCYDLYTKICQRLGKTPTAAPDNTLAQLHYIQTSICFLKEVVRLAAALNQEREKPGIRIQKSSSLVRSILDVKKRRTHKK